MRNLWEEEETKVRAYETRRALIALLGYQAVSSPFIAIAFFAVRSRTIDLLSVLIIFAVFSPLVVYGAWSLRKYRLWPFKQNSRRRQNKK